MRQSIFFFFFFFFLIIVNITGQIGYICHTVGYFCDSDFHFHWLLSFTLANESLINQTILHLYYSTPHMYKPLRTHYLNLETFFFYVYKLAGEISVSTWARTFYVPCISNGCFRLHGICGEQCLYSFILWEHGKGCWGSPSLLGA